jgi:hypothetical protein
VSASSRKAPRPVSPPYRKLIQSTGSSSAFSQKQMMSSPSSTPPEGNSWTVVRLSHNRAGVVGTDSVVVSDVSCVAVTDVSCVVVSDVSCVVVTDVSCVVVTVVPTVIELVTELVAAVDVVVDGKREVHLGVVVML